MAISRKDARILRALVDRLLTARIKYDGQWYRNRALKVADDRLTRAQIALNDKIDRLTEEGP